MGTYVVQRLAGTSLNNAWQCLADSVNALNIFADGLRCFFNENVVSKRG